MAVIWRNEFYHFVPPDRSWMRKSVLNIDMRLYLYKCPEGRRNADSTAPCTINKISDKPDPILGQINIL